MIIPEPLFLTWWTLIGLVTGSFLNVAIHRLPLETESVSKPRRSRCPQCKHELSWRENVPLVSWLVLRGRCRWCSWSIPWRYPLVEALTAGLFGFVAWRNGFDSIGLVLVHSLVLAGLVVSTFVDFDYFEIPDEISLGGLILAPLVSFALPELHAETWVARELSDAEGVDRVGAALGSLAGILAGGGALLLVRWGGEWFFKREAMGLGDVKLLAAGGGFVGPGGALVAFLAGTFLAAAVGVANMLRVGFLVASRGRRRGSRKTFGHVFAAARIASRYIPFGPYLGMGIGIALVAWNDVSVLLEELLLGAS